MLERKMTKTLLDWKENDKKHCLLIQGARQVGKTFIIEDFAKKNYKSYIYINFELTPEYKEIFNGNLDIKTLTMKLEASFPEIKIIPGNTLLFLDEIGQCPNARVALKTFALDDTIDCVASGSLLGLYYKEISSYPVGYEKPVNMYPLDFEEFLWAVGINKDLIDYARKSFKEQTPLDEYILKQFNNYFRMYMIVGGMPEVVDEYVKTSSMNKVIESQRLIIDTYKKDVLKYTESSERQRIISTFDSVPRQLSKKNKKFMYSDIEENSSKFGERKYTSSLNWLKDAGLINFCFNLSEPALPLAVNIRENCFKAYMVDTGLLISTLETGIQASLLNEDIDVNEGAIVENICAEEIHTRYNEIMYFEKKSKLEIDFVLNVDGVVAAIEVKSGNNKQAKSLKSIIENYKTVSRYIKFENNTNVYKEENGIEHYPLFMIMFL